ncbi:hypothetical protein PV10_02549 [Exophiala mesophila]|uniref:Uncharacterized protein n=1 Tax=Exophiala mesophila TaxID=212818 RepID=A0A0D1ZJL0_EXOME|nr:uncharacterized protein PV10_02549 [Exophiala mesophila]KIV94817.1 hypothetical protein PV10_02549 [Exophiala mesophila]
MPHERHRSRSRSPLRSEKRSRDRPRSPLKPKVIPLPLGASQLSRHSLSTYRPMFALYLDIQKQIDIEELDEREVKGRWKSFVGKWNRGELAEGWYDPQTLAKAQASSAIPDRRPAPTSRTEDRHDEDEEGEDDDEFGPSLPKSLTRTSHSHYASGGGASHSASVPSLQDLRARDEQAREDADRERDQRRQNMRDERAVDRKIQKDRLQEIAPRAEAGTRERMLENKREKADSNRAFAAAKDSGDVELRDEDVMGGEDSLGEMKRMKKENERRKNEREIRKEEILRARKAEREVRLAGLKEKEDKTMAMLKDIARARYGGGVGEAES